MIKIISNATFGFWNGTSVEPKTKDSKPFCVSSKREAELVALGIAEYVEKIDETLVSQGNGGETEFEVTKEYLKGLKLEQLKEFAEQFGVTYRIGVTKADFVNEVWEAITSTSENEAPSELELDENAPTFDAADAVV